MLDKCLEQFWAETTVITSKSRLALTGVAIVSIQAGATVLARIGLALILLLLTVQSHPASFTLTDVTVHNTEEVIMYYFNCNNSKPFSRVYTLIMI